MNISFVYPGFLFALVLLSIPIIIHLFNFRKFRKIYFTNVGFLKELKEETTSRSRLKHLLVLLARMLAVAFLVLAFAQPYFPAEEGKKIASERVVSILLIIHLAWKLLRGKARCSTRRKQKQLK